MKNLITLALAIFIAIPSVSSRAQGFYAGFGAGQSSADLETCDLDLSCTSEDTDTAYKLFAGYRFTPNWAIEAAYLDAGRLSQNGTDTVLGTASANFDVSGINLAALGIYPVTDRFSLQAKAGLFLWNLDVDVSSSTLGAGSISESGNSPMLGVGASYGFTERIGVLVEYERFIDVGEQDVTGESDVDIFSASLVFSF